MCVCVYVRSCVCVFVCVSNVKISAPFSSSRIQKIKKAYLYGIPLKVVKYIKTSYVIQYRGLLS